MEIYIFTQRFEAYSELFSIFQGENIRFRETEDTGVFRKEGSYALPRIVLADPRMLENYMPGTDHRAEGIYFLIGSPDHANGIAMEIRTLLKETSMQKLISVSGGAGPGKNLRTEPLRKPVRCVIGIAGMSPGAGTGLMTLLLAEEMASAVCSGNQQVTVFSPDDTGIYNSLGMKVRFEGRDFSDIAEMCDSEGGICSNIDEGINWAVSAPGSASLELLPAEKAAILSRLPGNYVIWEMGRRELALDIRQAKEKLDVLIFVIDPLPSAMIAGMAQYDIVKDCGLPVIWVINKWNSGIDRGAVLDFLEIEKPVIMPLMEQALIYRSEFACENPYRERAIRDEASDALQDIVKGIETITCCSG